MTSRPSGASSMSKLFVWVRFLGKTLDEVKGSHWELLLLGKQRFPVYFTCSSSVRSGIFVEIRIHKFPSPVGATYSAPTELELFG